MGGVCLTGDVHAPQLSSGEQAHLPANTTELDVAKEYADIAASANIPVTFFVSGLAAASQPRVFAALDDRDEVEIGGHTARSLEPDLLHQAFRRVWGSRYGPAFYQRFDVRRTTAALSKYGSRPTSWRTHCYASDDRTVPILAEEGYTLVSDAVVPDSRTHPWMDRGVCSLPVNTLRDHGHVYHANRTPAVVADCSSPGDDFNEKSYEPSGWLERIKAQIRSITSEGGIATIQAHPVCQYTADEYETLTALVRWLDREGIPCYECREIPSTLGSLSEQDQARPLLQSD